jgi:drug/metabolite transporter (DMT)-like permease
VFSAIVAACAYGVASVLQASAAGAAGDSGAGVEPGLLLNVLRQWRYLLGLGLDLLGFLAQLVALRDLPLFLVQAVLAASLAVTAIAALGLGVRLSRREWGAVIAVCVGLAMLGASARTGNSVSAGLDVHIALPAAALALGATGLAAGRLPRGAAAPVLGLIAGFCFGVVAIAARVLHETGVVAVLTDPAAYAVALGGLFGMVLYAAALQRGKVTTSTAMMVLGETVGPAVVGVVELGDVPRPGFAVLASIGFVLAVLAALALARFGEVKPAASGIDSVESLPGDQSRSQAPSPPPS